MAQDSIRSRLSQKIRETDADLKHALVISLLFHVGMLVLFVFGLPHFSSPKQIQESINVVEILTVSDITNVRIATPKAPKIDPNKKKASSAAEPKASLAEPVRREAPKVKIKPKPIRAREIEPLPKAIAKEPEPEAPQEKPEEKEPPKEEPEEVKKEEPVDAFASVLKSVESMEAKEQDETPQESNFEEVEDFLSTASKDSYQPGIPLSLSEIDAVRQQIMRNWTVLGGARDAQDMQVKLVIELARDGSVSNVEIVEQGRYMTDQFFRAMADSAVRAVKKSSPLKYLPEEKYDGAKGWNRMELTFDPREMLY